MDVTEFLHKLGMVADVEIVITLLPEMVGKFPTQANTGLEWGTRRTSPLKPKEGLNGAPSTTTRIERWAGGPFKPSVGLSGAVLRLDGVFLPLARGFLPSTRTRSPLVLRSPLRIGESCSFPIFRTFT